MVRIVKFLGQIFEPGAFEIQNRSITTRTTSLFEGLLNKFSLVK
jgi:hypothetical protein